MTLFDRRAWSRFVRISKPFFTSEKRWRAWGGVTLLFVLLLLLSGLNVVNSYVGRDFMTAIAAREPRRYAFSALLYLGVFLVLTIVSVFYQYTQDRLKLLWRQWLTQHFVDRYLAGQAYCRIIRRNDIDNPDQRISQDIKTFTATTVSFALTILNSTITILAFAGVLWSITPWLLLAAVLYALFGSVLTILLGRRLVGLNNLQLKTEADLRYELVRTREYCDTIALLHGERRERARIGGRLQSVVENFRAIITVIRNLGFFTVGFKYLVPLLPVLIVAPRYLRGEIEFGVVTQAAMAFAQILDQATELIVVQFQNLAEFVAVVLRLGTLWDAIAEAAAPSRPGLQIVEDDTRVAYEQLTLRTPKDGRPLIHKLSLEVPHGKRLLIEGPNGAGKSALIRATAGIWTEGEGRIIRPHRHQMMVLRQRPYTVPGSLRDQLLYGLPVDEISGDQLLTALHVVKFEPILERVGGLDVEQDWANTLSPGEQQLLAFARLLVANPPFALLEEAVSALDPRRCKQLYQILFRTSISYISVEDHVSLREYHDLVLDLHADGQWNVEPAQRAAVAQSVRLE
jgi:putative ATP-binding cassette transporter